MRRHLTLIAVATGLAGGPAAGETAADPNLGGALSPTGSALPDDGNGIADIIVTANKRDELQRDVANSVTAISGEDLTRRNEVRLQDLIGQVPGLSIEDASPTLSRIVLRGLNAGGVGSEVASVVDDVPTNPENAQNNGAVTTPNFDTYDLKRIEVLRGPQGTLYGATAEGGIVKYVTNPPELNTYSGSVEAGVEGLTAGGIGGTLKGYANIPLLENVAALRVSATNEWIPGYVDDQANGKTDANSGQQYSYRASLLVKPTEDLTIRLTAQRQSLFSNADNLVQAVGAAATPSVPPGNQLSLVNGLRNDTLLPNIGQVETGVYYADINYDFGPASITSLTSYTFGNFKYSTDLTNTNVAAGTSYGQYVSALVYNQPTLLNEPENLENGKFNQEVRISSNPGTEVFGRALDWQAGVYYTHEASGLQESVSALSAANPAQALSPSAGGVAIDESLSEWAVFGQVTYHLTPSVDVDLGGRFAGTDQHSQTFNTPGVFFPAANFPALTSNDHDALYSVAPRWRIDDDTLGYLRVATGYRPGGPNIQILGVTGLPTSYTPDRTVNYEIGIRRDFFDKKVQVDLTGFLVHWKSVQITSIVTTSEGQFGVEGNAGSATSKGLEWSLAWAPLRGLKLTAEGSYTDARLTDDAPGLGGRNGDFLPYVPNVTSGVNIDYSWSAFDDYEAFVSGTWAFVGERYTDFAPAGPVTSHVLLPSYNTGSIRAGVENERYGAEVFVNNISDERGITTYANSGGPNATGLVTLIEPRLIGATLRVKF